MTPDEGERPIGHRGRMSLPLLLIAIVVGVMVAIGAVSLLIEGPDAPPGLRVPDAEGVGAVAGDGGSLSLVVVAALALVALVALVAIMCCGCRRGPAVPPLPPLPLREIVAGLRTIAGQLRTAGSSLTDAGGKIRTSGQALETAAATLSQFEITVPKMEKVPNNPFPFDVYKTTGLDTVKPFSPLQPSVTAAKDALGAQAGGLDATGAGLTAAADALEAIADAVD